jgi:hypothetical protein
MEENNELFLKCDCHTEAIQIQHWKEDQSFYFSFWDYGRSKVSWMPWKKRLNLIWRIIRGKDLYADMVILDYEKSKKVADFINQILENDVQSNSIKNQKR